MKKLLLLAAAASWACSAAEAPAPPVEPAPPPPPAPTLAELQSTYLPRIEDVERSVSAFEERREEIVERKLADRERLRELQEIRRGELAAQGDKIALLEDQLADRRARIARLGERGDGPLRRELEQESARLEREVAQESAELAAAEAEHAAAAADLERLETADAEGLFRAEVQPLYRQGIELHLGFYQGLIELTRQRLAPGENAAALIDHFSGRLAERRALLAGQVEPAAFAALRHELELDRRMSQAWLSALILEVRFELGQYRLETISREELRELELLAEALEESWSTNPRLVMFVDGHADSRGFRGVTPCVSATKNRELSRQRAAQVRDFFRQRLGGDERIRLDWFGNFSLRTGARSDELENRRIELRVAAERDDGGFDAHREYFAMRHGLELAGRIFRRTGGAWVEEPCAGREADAEVEYLSPPFAELAARLELDAAAGVRLGAEDREIEVRLGNAFVVDDGGRCVAVRPCPDPSP
jgi:outer membrane protein OmpA-like peptidoglycan-associated protein